LPSDSHHPINEFNFGAAIDDGAATNPPEARRGHKKESQVETQHIKQPFAESFPNEGSKRKAMKESLRIENLSPN